MAKRTTVKGIKGLSAQLQKMGMNVEANTEAALVAGALVLQNGMKVRAPRRTRTLARSIHIGGHKDAAPDYTDSGAATGQQVPGPERSKGKVKVYVGTNVVYAAIQEFGGTITPVRAKFLRFQIDGEWVSVKSVRIPAHPYVRPTFDEDGDEAVREVGEALRDIIRAAAK